MAAKGYYVQMKPFDKDKRNGSNVQAFQEKCIKEKICGMGWNEPEILRAENNKVFLSEHENKKTYLEKYKKIHEGTSQKSLSQALNRYSEIEAGDYLLTRIYKSGACHIGKVKSKTYRCSQERFKNFVDAEAYSWVIDVDWKEIGHFSNISNAFRGALSGRWNTIKRMSDFNFRLAQIIFEGLNEEVIKLDKENFCNSLDSTDLEDLVSFYMLKENPGYHVIPSSCKKDEPQIEFKMVKGKNQITCQVKNNAYIDVSAYSSDIFKHYSKIYLFSGKGYLKHETKAENIHIIEKEQLYELLKKDFEDEGYFYNTLKKCYKISYPD